MQGNVVDPAPFCVPREFRDLAFGVDRNKLAIVATHDDAAAVGGRTKDPAAMDGDPLDLPFRVNQRHAFLRTDKAGARAEEMRRGDRRAERDRAHAVGD
jgi:hypothetical protein